MGENRDRKQRKQEVEFTKSVESGCVGGKVRQTLDDGTRGARLKRQKGQRLIKEYSRNTANSVQKVSERNTRTSAFINHLKHSDACTAACTFLSFFRSFVLSLVRSLSLKLSVMSSKHFNYTFIILRIRSRPFFQVAHSNISNTLTRLRRAPVEALIDHLKH